MLASTVFLAAVVAVLLALAIAKGHGAPALGIKNGLTTMLQVAPVVILAFLVIGLLPAVIPKEVILKWAGAESGVRGVFVGTLAGAVAPGGPVIQSVLAAGLLKSGAGIGTIVAFLTSGAIWALFLVPVEIGILGPRVVAIKLLSSFFFPPFAGLIAEAAFGSWKP